VKGLGIVKDFITEEEAKRIHTALQVDSWDERYNCKLTFSNNQISFSGQRFQQQYGGIIDQISNTMTLKPAPPLPEYAIQLIIKMKHVTITT
jgi:hypothetical protein